MKDREHLPIFGIGPVYGAVVIVTALAGIALSMMGKLDSGKVQSKGAVLFMIVAGTALCIYGAALWWPTAFGKNSIPKYIEENKLCVTGVYKIVRNPCYTGLTFIWIGFLIIAHNLWLFILPFFYWIVMTEILKNTEEKWLFNIHGEAYRQYCSRVNRCIPWFPKKDL